MNIQKILKSGSILENIAKCDRLTEPAFIEYAENKAIETLTILQTNEGGYVLAVTLTWKDGLSVLETTRNTVREWVDFDRLSKHISEKYPRLTDIQVILNKEFVINQHMKLKGVKAVCFDSEYLQPEKQ